MLHVGVLGSTRGTDLQAIIDAIEKKEITDVKISVVISNKKDAFILERARTHHIPAVFIEYKDKSREEFDKDVTNVLEQYRVKVVLLIGYMRFLSRAFIDLYRNRIINVHPSLLPAFAGGMDKNVHEAVLKAGVKETGCTVHFVDEGADTGPVIMQKKVAVELNETVDSLKAKVQKEEGKLLIETLKLYRDGKIKVEGDKVKTVKIIP